MKIFLAELAERKAMKMERSRLFSTCAAATTSLETASTNGKVIEFIRDPLNSDTVTAVSNRPTLTGTVLLFFRRNVPRPALTSFGTQLLPL